MILAQVKTQDEFDWVQSKGKFVSSLGLVDGELDINPEFFSVESIVLIGSWNKEALGTYKVSSGPHISSSEKMKSLNHPNIEDDYMFAVFNVEVDTRYKNISWDFSEINEQISVYNLDKVIQKFT
ncbi:hypothetical protein D3C72_1776590 [compost metagenome]